MKYTQEDIQKQFEKLGIVRWDFFPPEEGTIKYFNQAGEKVAEGNYKIILSYGPGEEYTMAWDIGVYNRFPKVEKLSENQPANVSPATEDEAFAKAIEIGEQINADYVYKAMTMYVAVFDFHPLI